VRWCGDAPSAADKRSCPHLAGAGRRHRSRPPPRSSPLRSRAALHLGGAAHREQRSVLLKATEHAQLASAATPAPLRPNASLPCSLRENAYQSLSDALPADARRRRERASIEGAALQRHFARDPRLEDALARRTKISELVQRSVQREAGAMAYSAPRTAARQTEQAAVGGINAKGNAPCQKSDAQERRNGAVQYNT
jgi:hypothetical protein